MGTDVVNQMRGQVGQQPDLARLLGQVGYLPDRDEATAGSGLPVTNSASLTRVRVVRFGGAYAPGSRVKWTSAFPGTRVEQAGVNEVACGVVDPELSANTASGDVGLIVEEGLIDVLSGAAFSINDSLEGDASGKFKTAVGGFVEAIAVEAATAADENKRAYVSFPTVSPKSSDGITLTADASESATNTIPAGVERVTVGGVTTDANDFIVLPALADVPAGFRITVIGGAGSNFEVRTPATSNEEINSEDCDGTKEYLFTDTQIHYFTKIDNTIGWMGNGFTAIGAVATAVIPD